jgi:hypothetical protein
MASTNANALSVKPEIVVKVLFGYAIPRVHIESLNKSGNGAPNMYVFKKSARARSITYVRLYTP